MNFCACKTKTSQEIQSMCQNAQQHDTGIDPLVLQMLLPLHSLHLLLSHWRSQMLLPPHCVYICFSPTGTGAHRCCCRHIFAAAPLPLALTDAATDTALHSLRCHCCLCSLLHSCIQSSRPLKHLDV